VMRGAIALKQPTQAIAQVRLTEPDIHKAFEAQLVRQRLEKLDDPRLTALSGGNPVSFGQVVLQLCGNGKIALQAQADLGDRQVPLSMGCTLGVERRRRMRFNDVEFRKDDIPEGDRELSGKLTAVMGEILDNMVDLDRFNLDGVMLRLNRLEMRGKDGTLPGEIVSAFEDGDQRKAARQQILEMARGKKPADRPRPPRRLVRLAGESAWVSREGRRVRWRLGLTVGLCCGDRGAVERDACQCHPMSEVLVTHRSPEIAAPCAPEARSVASASNTDPNLYPHRFRRPATDGAGRRGI